MAQDLKREQPVRLPNPSAQPFVAALKTTRFYAVLFYWIAMVSILAYVAAFVLVEWARLYDAGIEALQAPAAPAARGPGLFVSTAQAAEKGPSFFGLPAGAPRKDGAKAEAPASGSTPAVPAAPASPPTVEGTVVAEPPVPAAGLPAAFTPEQVAERSRHYRHVTANVLRPLRVVGTMASSLLGLTLFLYLEIALLGRLSGIRQLTNAVFLLLIFFATVLPWDSIFEGFRVSAFYNFDRLLEAHVERLTSSAPRDLWDHAAYFARYLALPVASALFLVGSGLQFAGGFSESVTANE